MLHKNGFKTILNPFFAFQTNISMRTDLPNNIDLNNAEFQRAFELLKSTNANVFLTGKAGTGKSTFLKYICKKLHKKHVVLAPTGVAAVNVGGVTIHSFFQMPLRPVPPDDPDYSVKALSVSKKFSRQKRKLLMELDLIIIDEVSMVRPDMIDFIDRTLRGIRGKRGLPFGGVQLLLVGDIFQLEPVVTPDTKAILSRYYPDFFFFNALAYTHTNLVSIELRKIYRQTDSKFIEMLDRIRINKVTESDFAILNSRIVKNENIAKSNGEMFGIVLASRRDAAAAINSEKMDELPSEETVFEGKIEDDFPEKILPTDLNLVLKENAQVMLIRNDKERRWVNGTLARIKCITQDSITVEFEDGREAKVEKEVWENITYAYDEKEKKVKEEVIGRFTQYPLKAAWALTIHKSQGLTFNNVTIDMGGGAFSAGQTYVALSRCRSLEGLRFINPLRQYDVIVSHGAAEFSRNFNDKKALEKALNQAKATKLSQEAKDDFILGKFNDTVEKLWEIHSLIGALSNKSVRRLVSKFLEEIRILRRKVKSQDKILKELSKEFAEMGEITLSEADNIDAVQANFEKALKLDPDNIMADIGKAKCLAKKGSIKKACGTLDKIIRKRGKMYYEACMLKGDIQAGEGDLSQAALNYQAAAKNKPNKKEPILRLIELYENAGMDESADQWRKWLDD